MISEEENKTKGYEPRFKSLLGKLLTCRTLVFKKESTGSLLSGNTIMAKWGSLYFLCVIWIPTDGNINMCWFLLLIKLNIYLLKKSLISKERHIYCVIQLSTGDYSFRTIIRGTRKCWVQRQKEKWKGGTWRSRFPYQATIL